MFILNIEIIIIKQNILEYMYNMAGYIFMNGIFLYFKQVLRFTVSDPILNDRDIYL